MFYLGQHKFNPNVEAAKKGELPPKPKPISKREAEIESLKRIYRFLGFPV